MTSDGVISAGMVVRPTEIRTPVGPDGPAGVLLRVIVIFMQPVRVAERLDLSMREPIDRFVRKADASGSHQLQSKLSKGSSKC